MYNIDEDEMGMLTVFYRVNGNESDKDAVGKIIEDAENASSRTCRYCGNPAEEVTINGWHFILCVTCRKKMKLKRFQGTKRALVSAPFVIETIKEAV